MQKFYPYGRTHRNHGGSGEAEISSREERNHEEWRGLSV